MTVGAYRNQRFCIPTLIVLLGLLAASGCSSRAKSNEAAPGSAGDEKSAATTGDAGTHVDVMCIGDRINNPPEAFHYSFGYTDASGAVGEEADITPQAMNIIIKDKSGSHSYHGVRSDETSWGQAVLDLSSLKLTVMSSRLDALNDTSALTRQGPEAINGYQTVKYAIDTTRANPSDQKNYEALLGKGSYEKGTVWIPADGCAVKLILDEGSAQTNGSVDKAHYEIARIRAQQPK
jgi:hypothetical protein